MQEERETFPFLELLFKNEFLLFRFLSLELVSMLLVILPVSSSYSNELKKSKDWERSGAEWC